MSKPNFDYGPTPFSPCSFDYQPGTPDNRVSFFYIKIGLGPNAKTTAPKC